MDKKKPIVIGLGELLWDLFPGGKQLGGAPANFVYHISHMDIDGYLISAVGNDNNGREIIEALKKREIETRYVQILDGYPTGTVSVALDREGSPSYTIHEGVAWDHIGVNDDILKLVKTADAICFGTLAQRCSRSGNSIERLLSVSADRCLKVYDINLRQQYYSKDTIETSLTYADVLKMNEDELKVLGEMEQISGDDTDIMKTLMSKYKLTLIALTRGAQSSTLLGHDQFSTIPSPKIQVADTVGAGDSFTAALVAGLLKGMEINDVHKKAVDTAAWVCTQNGAMPGYGVYPCKNAKNK